MTRLFTVAGLVAALLLVAGAASLPAASSETTDGTPTTLQQPRPTWLTPELEAQIVAAGPKGVEVPLAPADALEVNFLGTAPPYGGRTESRSPPSPPAPAWSRPTAAR